jgi:glycosyltransferase involved in cell wall biosynthesis
MKILQINNSEAVVGGSERVYHLTSELLAQHGHEVCSLSCGEAPVGQYKRAYLLPRNAYHGSSVLDAVANAGRFLHRPSAATLLGEILDRERPDVAHLHIFYGQLSSAILPVLRSRRVPTVMSVHEYRLLCPTSTMFRAEGTICEACAGGRYWNAIRHRCNRQSLSASALSALECFWRDAWYDYAKYIDHFIMVSEFCRRKHLAYLPELEGKSSTIYNFVEQVEGPPIASPQSPRHLLYAGRLSVEKGVESLLAVVARLPHVTLDVAGTGALQAQLTDRYARCPNIRFLGHLSRESLRERMSRATYSVVPSIWYENNPMSILESFASGTPVIATDIGGIPELVAEGATGFLYRPRDAASLEACLAKAATVEDADLVAMGRRCQELVRTRHGPSTHLEALLATYDRVIRSRAA